MAVTSGVERHGLRCGRSVEDVDAHLQAGLTDCHEQGCPHCTAAVVSLTGLAAATSELAEDETDRLSPETHDRVMATVRSEVRRHDRLPSTTASPPPAPDPPNAPSPS